MPQYGNPVIFVLFKIYYETPVIVKVAACTLDLVLANKVVISRDCAYEDIQCSSAYSLDYPVETKWDFPKVDDAVCAKHAISDKNFVQSLEPKIHISD
jgi:hypothetical protein